MKGESSLTRARITYMFKETFRAHSRDEYREFVTRGLGEDKRGITGTYPWLYVRLFFMLFMLFTVNTLILRFTGNTLFVPAVTFFAGITFTVPFTVLLFELYQKRDLNIFKLLGILIIGGCVASLITQLGYALIKVENKWLSVLATGFIEETSKGIVAIAAIMVMKKKNSYACFLIAAAVGAGFSIVEDTGYLFYYSDMLAASYGDIREIVYMFIDRGLSTFCTHILWTGIIGWAYGYGKGRKPLFVLFLIYSIFLHTLWNLPLEGFIHSAVIAICTLLTVISALAAVRKSLFETISNETDIARINDNIIKQAKEMGERMRFTNAANLTFSLMCTLLSVLAIALCCLPIGMAKVMVTYSNPQSFIYALQDGYNIKADWSRPYDENGVDVEVRYTYDGDELKRSYVVQEARLDGYEGVYYYGYYINGNGVADRRADSIYLELDDISSRIPCVEYTFGSETLWAFEVSDDYSDYSYNKSDGTVSCVKDAEEFGGYNLLIGLVAGAVAISGACSVILFAFTIKLRRLKDER